MLSKASACETCNAGDDSVITAGRVKISTAEGGIASSRNIQLDVFQEYWGQRVSSWQPAELPWAEEVVVNPMVVKGSPFHSQNEVQVYFI
jgi:hypothetical protein